MVRNNELGEKHRETILVGLGSLSKGSEAGKKQLHIFENIGKE